MTSVAVRKEAADDRRRFPRFVHLASGTLRTGDVTVACQVLDISANGAQIRPVGEVARSGSVSFDFNGFGTFEGEIRWTEGRRYGVQFTENPVAVSTRLRDYLPHEYRVS